MHTKLTGLFLENFQAIKRPTYLELSDITMLIGPNSVGKSSVIDALEIISLIACGTEWRSAREVFEKLSAEYGPQIGVEFVVGDKEKTSMEEKNRREKWAAVFSSHNDLYCTPEEFISDLSGRKVKIIFGAALCSVVLFIDGEKIFEVSDQERGLDAFCRPVELNAVWSLRGRFRLFLGSSFAKKYLHDVLDFEEVSALAGYPDNPFVPLFLSNASEFIDLFGVTFQIGEDRAFAFDSSETTDVLRGRYCKFSDHKSVQSTKFKKFREAHFESSSGLYERSKGVRNLIEWRFERIDSILNIYFEGLLILLQRALSYRLVGASRTSLDSSQPAFVSGRMGRLVSISSTFKSAGDYAEGLASGFNGFTREISRDDFVNFAISRYMPSIGIKGVVGDALSIVSLPSTALEADLTADLVFISVLDAAGKKRGFEDVGSGVSFVFPILTALWSGGLSFIEQPELHLHPKAQCELGDVFVVARNRGAQSVIETHSEHVILRFLRRIRESTQGKHEEDELKLSPEQLLLYFFEPNGDGTTKVKRIRVDEDGEFLDRWPGGFFSEREGELFS